MFYSVVKSSCIVAKSRKGNVKHDYYLKFLWNFGQFITRFFPMWYDSSFLFFWVSNKDILYPTEQYSE